MKRSVIVLSAVVGLSASAFAAPFNALSYEMGGGIEGIAGPGITTTSGGFYNPTGAGTNGNTSPGSPFAASNPWSEAQAYDSYFTLTGNGPARLTEADGGTDTLTPQLASFYPYADSFDAPSTIAGPGSHISATNDNDGQAPFAAATPVNRARGGFATDPNVSGNSFTPSGINPKSGQDGVFIGQLTLNRGSTFTTDSGIFLAIRVGNGVQSDGTLLVNGPAVEFATAPGVMQMLVLKAYLVATNNDLVHSRAGGNAGTGSGTTQRFGAADVYHLWVEVIPAPTAVAAFGLAGLAGLRRRRA